MSNQESNVVLSEVMALDLFKTSTLLTGAENLEKVVSSVNVMLDSEVIEWIEEDGQILLTTGQVFAKLTEAELMNFFESLVSKNVTGVFVKVKPYIEGFGPEIVDYCKAQGLSIVDLDYEVSFTDIFSVVYNLMFQKQTAILKRVETLHKDTMGVVMEGGSIDDVLRSIGKTISAPIFIRDYYFEDTYFLKTEFEEIYALLYENIETVQFDGKQSKLIRDQVAYRGGEIERLVIPIFVKNQVYGHIVAYGKDQGISNYDKLGLEAASNIIAIEFLKKISVQEVENKYRLEFFDDLISLDENRRGKAVERASNFRFSENASYVVLSIRMAQKGDVDMEERLLKASYLTDLVCKDLGHSYLILNKSNTVHILVMLKEGEGLSVVKRYTKYIHEILKSRLKRQKVRIGSGRIYKGIHMVHKSLLDASRALEAAMDYLNQDIVFFEEMGVYKVLSNTAIKTELEIFLKDILEPLMAYDARKDTELIKTLMVYFECNGNLKRMSEVLFTHYNTILYRLSRIQEIIGLSLDDEENRYAIHTALKVHKIFNM